MGAGEPSDLSASEDEVESNLRDKDDDGYQLRHVLKHPLSSKFNPEELYNDIRNGEIELNAGYQRNSVWSTEKQIKLIDSIFRNFPIPPIVFALKSGDGVEIKTCIDGKQRLLAIQHFMDGLIPHRDLNTGETFWYKINPEFSTEDPPRRTLPEKYRILFCRRSISCLEYEQVSISDERDIFQRVQVGIGLTPAECMQGQGTPRAEFIRHLQRKYLSDPTSGLAGPNIQWIRARGNDFRCFAQAVYILAASPSDGTPALPSISVLESWLAIPEDFTLPFKQDVLETLDVLVILVNEPGQTLFRDRLATVELVFTIVLISRWREKEGVGSNELARMIGRMRKEVRKRYEDFRGGESMVKTFFFWVEMGTGTDTGAHGENQEYGPAPPPLPPPPHVEKKKKSPRTPLIVSCEERVKKLKEARAELEKVKAEEDKKLMNQGPSLMGGLFSPAHVPRRIAST